MDEPRPGFGPDFEDLALAMARANQAGNPTSVNGGFAAAATPSNLTAPSSAVLAAKLFTAQTTGVGLVIATFGFTVAAAATVTITAQIVPAATAIAHGTVNGTWHVEDGGTAVAITGGTPATVQAWTKSYTTAELIDSNTLMVPFIAAVGGQIGFQYLITCSQNLSSLNFNAAMWEIL